MQRNRLMTRLADMKPFEQSNKAMRDAVDELCATVRALLVQGVTPKQYGALLMPLIESKLPKDWRLEWAREKAGLAKDDVTFSKLLKFLSVNWKSRRVLTSRKKRTNHLNSNLWEDKKAPLSTASGLMAKSVSCTFCKGNDCSVQMSVGGRFNKVRDAKACFRCGPSEHRMATCRHRKPCQCGRGSHILQLCETGGVKMPYVSNPPPVNSPSHPIWNPAAAPYVPNHNQTLPMSQPPQAAATSSARNADIKSAGVMIRIVCVAIGNVTVRALCDTGATFTLMSSQLASIVPKTVVGKRRLWIETLGEVLDGEFHVFEVTARGVNLTNTLSFQECSRGWYLSPIKLLRRLLVVVQSSLISLALVQTILALCLEKIAMTLSSKA